MLQVSLSNHYLGSGSEGPFLLGKFVLCSGISVRPMNFLCRVQNHRAELWLGKLINQFLVMSWKNRMVQVQLTKHSDASSSTFSCKWGKLGAMNELNDVSLILQQKLPWNFEPLLFVLIGSGYYVYRKFINPISKRTIDELDSKSFLGMDGSRYSPFWGFALIVLGLLGFIILNWPKIFG